VYKTNENSFDQVKVPDGSNDSNSPELPN